MPSDFNKSKKQAPDCAIAIGYSDGCRREVRVVRTDSGYEVAHTDRKEQAGATFDDYAGAFAAEGETCARAAVFDGGGVIYHCIEVPSRAAGELEAIVQAQVEALLPLPPDKVEIGWRKGKASKAGKLSVTIAAARRENVVQFARTAAPLQPDHMALAADSLVMGWRHFCNGSGDAVLMRIRRNYTDLCLVEQGMLVRAARIDIGSDELWRDNALSLPAAEMLTQDVRSTVTVFQCENTREIQILSDDSPVVTASVEHMRSEGLNIRPVKPEPAGVYEYLDEIGAAIMALEETETLNLFSRFIEESKSSAQGKQLPWKAAAAIAAAALLAAALGWYALDKATLARSSELLARQRGDISVKDMLERYHLVNTIAAERVNILELMQILSETESHGVVLHALHFRKGRPVSVTGEAPSNEALYNFEAALRTQQGIANVREQNVVIDERERKVTFTVTFNYRHFTSGRDIMAVFER